MEIHNEALIAKRTRSGRNTIQDAEVTIRQVLALKRKAAVKNTEQRQEMIMEIMVPKVNFYFKKCPFCLQLRNPFHVS